VHNDTIFLSKNEVVDYSILVGVDETNHELIVGIIDYLRLYAWAEKLETGAKQIARIGGRGTPTVISPHNYKKRFRSAMDRYFMVAPGRDLRLID